MDYVLGIDGGGTKTKAAIADINGSIVGASEAGPTNPNIISRSQLKRTLETLFSSLEEASRIPLGRVKNLFAGISGAGNETNKQLLQALIESSVSDSTAIQIEADAVNALYSGTYGYPGIVQISGTGSITYGVNRHFKHERVGGWGYLFGDEGSGFDIGRQAIIKTLKSVDGRGADTIMLSMILSYFGVVDAQSLVQKIYDSSSPKSAISPLTEIVFQAYKQHDPLAKSILQEAASQMVLSIETLYIKHFEPDERINAVLTGGVFNEENILPEFIKRALNHRAFIDVVLPGMSPVGGSVIGALLMADKNVDNGIINRLIKTV